MVAEFARWIDAVVEARDPARLFDTSLTASAPWILWRARGSYSLCAGVLHRLGKLHRERWRCLGDEEGATDHDLWLLFQHSQLAARPQAVLREAEVLRRGRHLPTARRRRRDQRPFSEYLASKRRLVAMRRGVPGDDVVADARHLSRHLFDPHLKADVDDFLRSIGEEPPPPVRPEAPSPAAPSPVSSGHDARAGGRPERPIVQRYLELVGVLHAASPAERAMLKGSVAAEFVAAEAAALAEAERQERRFHATGDPALLQDAMSALGDAEFAGSVSRGLQGHEDKVRSACYAGDHARLFRVRFLHSCVWDDIHQATVSVRLALDRLPVEETELKAGYLMDLGRTLMTAHEHKFNMYGAKCGPDEVEEAVTALRDAWDLVAPGASPEREHLPATILLHLGHCLARRALVLDDADEADRGVTEALDVFTRAGVLLRESAAIPDTAMTASPDAPDRAELVSCLRMYRAQATMLWAMARVDRAKLEEVRSEAARRVAATAHEPQCQAQWQQLLGYAEAALATLFGKAGADEQALAALGAAATADSGTEAPFRQINAVRLYATLAMGNEQWTAAADQLRLGLGLAREQDALGIPASARRQWLLRARGLLADLVTCLVSAGESEQAVVALEEHRAILLHETLGDRTETVGLARAVPALAREYREASDALHRFDTGTDATSPNHAARRLALLARRDRVTQRIRAVEGFERFRRAPRHEDLAAVARDGEPVVLLSTGSLRGDALVLRSDGTRAVRLPRLGKARTEELVRTLYGALNGAEAALAEQDQEEYLRRQRAVGDVLEALWESAVAPVLETAGLGQQDAPRRVWWVPSGPLCYLPLHAASVPGGPSLLDLAVSSYAPTVRLLQHGRRRTPVTDRRPLVVSMPETPGASSLPGADQEADFLADLFPRARTLRGAAATRDAFERELAGHPWLHFAGHGINTHDGAVLLLHDCEERPFSTDDVLRLDLPDAELAFLSACETTQNSILLPDESTHFGAALAVAGYRDVVGTLWRVNDQIAVRVTRSFYGRLTSGEYDPALALHEAIRELRAAYPRMPGLWASHIHIGP
ncbi:CHAT domain-containing protein [Streptomyces botrytidirepellens]|uniref:CHAT domain-containing protein n=1 Tax=Streptomyces botrytidirepellens TaxID=2486417 RepID=A0A3M8VLW1_9ACTN|nr:CHAT domain-containing protein [Streptomyces botrytidirepellens]